MIETIIAIGVLFIFIAIILFIISAKSLKISISGFSIFARK
jgi:hypothetical protein